MMRIEREAMFCGSTVFRGVYLCASYEIYKFTHSFFANSSVICWIFINNGSYIINDNMEQLLLDFI